MSKKKKSKKFLGPSAARVGFFTSSRIPIGQKLGAFDLQKKRKKLKKNIRQRINSFLYRV